MSRWPIPLSYWTGALGLLAVTGNLLLQPASFTNLGTLLAVVLNLACLIVVPCFPLPAWLSYLVLFLFLSLQPEISVLVITFIAPVMTGLVVYRGYLVTGLCGSWLLWYSASINPLEGIFFPSDALASVIWAVFLGAAIIVGHVLYRNASVKRTYEYEDQARRESLARTLHDAVATSLTSVVVRAETMSLRNGIDKEIAADLGLIARQARHAMKEVRGLLQVLENGVESRTSDPQQSFAKQLQNTCGFLKSHGYTVDAPGSWPELLLDAEGLAVLKEILAEVSANILKYAEPSSLIEIQINEHGNNAVICLSNSIGAAGHDASKGTGLGLLMISQLIESIGGESRVSASVSSWNLKLKLPLTQN